MSPGFIDIDIARNVGSNLQWKWTTTLKTPEVHRYSTSQIADTQQCKGYVIVEFSSDVLWDEVFNKAELKDSTAENYHLSVLSSFYLLTVCAERQKVRAPAFARTRRHAYTANTACSTYSEHDW